uniref:Carboxylic ester hydrolase n=1 Tax=Jaculus jaculus TaxID=51337 RepID=A0A8C5LH97_JACJA
MHICALFFVCLAACVAWGHPSSPPVVNTAHGKVQGKYVSSGLPQPVAVFLGVPFAKPPLGSLRFASPKPPEPWIFVKNTTTYPPMCSQDVERGKLLAETFTNRKESIALQFSEDCLYLNIYTPADLTKTSRLPVMVWIHGGGLVEGGAIAYNGLALSAHENVVVVVIQYRLGIWGSFSTEDEHSRGNWAHLDQVAALRWVQDNIANFGGNPGSVTIFGESSGGQSVSVLVLSPLAKNLFHRAIAQSGVALTPGLVGNGIRHIAEQIATISGCKTTTSAVMVDCMRRKTEDELLETTMKLSYFRLNLHEDNKKNHIYIPSLIDGVLLPKAPGEILAEKNFNTVPFLVGITKHEFGWIIPKMMGIPPAEVKMDQKMITLLLKKFSSTFGIPEDILLAASEKYLKGTDDPAHKRYLLLELFGDVMFGIPSVIVSRSHRDAGAPTYMYEFQHRPSISSDERPMTVKGDHGDEIDSVFGGPFLRGVSSKEELNLSKMVMKYWANFARNGNPNGEGLPHWPVYDQKEGYLQIDVTTQAAQRLKDKEVALWTELLAKKPLQTQHTEL